MVRRRRHGGYAGCGWHRHHPHHHRAGHPDFGHPDFGDPDAGHHDWGHRGHHADFGPGPYRGGWDAGWQGPPSRIARFLAARVEATPEQAKVIRDELEVLFETTRPLRRELRLSRDDVARALRTEAFDEEIMGESFARQDERITEVRKAMVGALARIHDVLDERQRARLATLVDAGPFARPRWM